MWIFTSKGFISAVVHRDDSSLMMVRARRQEHLEALFPGGQILQTPSTDYKYRVVVHRDTLAATVLQEIERMDYANFKNSIADHAYHDACSQVWRVMHRLQPGSYMPDPTPDFFDSDEDDMASGEVCPTCGSDNHVAFCFDEDQAFTCRHCGDQWTVTIRPISGAFGDPSKYDDDDDILPTGMT